MPKHLRNDRILKRPLIFLAILGFLGILVYAFMPDSFFSEPDELHHTASEDEPIIQIPLPDDDISPSAETSLPTPPNTAEKPLLPASSTTQNPPPATNNKGKFVKKYQVFQNAGNFYQHIENSHFNPVLIRQLSPLQRRLEKPGLRRVEILYADYIKNHQSDPQNSKIIAVRFNSTNKTEVYYAKSEGRSLYFYDEQGNAPEAAMDRIPLTSYQRISSPFNPKRRHPITRVIRPHNGTDFKAPYGTAVHSTGNGVVSFAGIQHGYGKVIMINHPNGYQTRYAHLSAIEVRQGQNVKRGQNIGKLGNSGASTGAHLHYEVRINGIPYNPMTVTLPSLKPLAKNYMSAWKYRTNQYLQAMNELAATGKTDL